MEDKSSKNDLISKIIDKIFTIKKSHIYLFIILIIGFTLRLIATLNLRVYGDDALHGLRPINFISSGRLETYDQSSGLWYAFTDVIYSLFKISTLTSRTASLIFGTLSIILIYFLTNEFFNKKISLISSFLLAISPFLIRNMLAEMDTMAMFFVLFSMFLFVKALKQKRYKLYAISGLFLGLGIYTKVYPLFFIPSLLLFFIFYNKKEKNKVITKDNLKKIFIFLVTILIFTIPVLTHNYLLYKEKGFLDLQFTRATGVGKEISEQYYSWDVQFDRENSWKGLIFGDISYGGGGKPLLLAATDFIRGGNPILFYLGILGILIILTHKRTHLNYLVFFLLNILFILPLLASIILLPKHFLFLEIMLIPLSAFSLSELCKRITFNGKKFTKYLFVLVFVFSLFWLTLPTAGYPVLMGKSHITQVIDFKNEEIPQNSIIVVDSRIYSGRSKWLFHGRPYLDGVEFIQFMNSQDEIEGDIKSIDLFYMECVKDDCGWGGGKITPEFNETLEGLTDFFKANGELVKEIDEPSEVSEGYKINSQKEKIIKIYKARLDVKDSVFALANQPQVMHLYTIGYILPNTQFDYYKPDNFLDHSIYQIAKWVVKLSVLLSLLSIIYVFYLSKKLIFKP